MHWDVLGCMACAEVLAVNDGIIWLNQISFSFQKIDSDFKYGFQQRLKVSFALF